MKVRIIRACNVWLEGDTPDLHADYARKLIANGLAEGVTASVAPIGQTNAATKRG